MAIHPRKRKFKQHESKSESVAYENNDSYIGEAYPNTYHNSHCWLLFLRTYLQFPDDSSKTFTLRSDVDLNKQAVGQEVIIRTTDAMAISVEKP